MRVVARQKAAEKAQPASPAALSYSDHLASELGRGIIFTTVAGSPIAIPLGPASTTPDDLRPFFAIVNLDTTVIWLKRLYCLLSGAQTSELSLDVLMTLDVGTNLLTAPPAALLPANFNPLVASPALAAQAFIGQLTKVAKSVNAIQVHRSKPRATPPVAGDETIFKFGATEGPSSANTTANLPFRTVIDCAPVVVPPGYTLSVHAAFGATSTGAPAMEIEASGIQRW